MVGAATGYSAAVLARLVGSVVALEEDAELAAFAERGAGRDRRRAGRRARSPRAMPTAAPYDFILIDGAVEHVPQAIVAQLADGGRIALALLEDGVTRLCHRPRRSAARSESTAFADAAAAVLPGFAKPRGFSF